MCRLNHRHVVEKKAEAGCGAPVVIYFGNETTKGRTSHVLRGIGLRHGVVARLPQMMLIPADQLSMFNDGIQIAEFPIKPAPGESVSELFHRRENLQQAKQFRIKLNMRNVVSNVTVLTDRVHSTKN